MIDRFIEVASRATTFEDKNAVIRWARNQKREKKDRVEIELSENDIKLRDELWNMLSGEKKEVKKPVKKVEKKETKKVEKKEVKAKDGSKE